MPEKMIEHRHFLYERELMTIKSSKNPLKMLMNLIKINPFLIFAEYESISIFLFIV